MLSSGSVTRQFKLVAYAPNGFKHPFIGYAFKLFAEALYMYVNGTRVAEIVKSPNLIKKLVSGEHAIIVRREEIKKLELLRGDINALTVELKLILLLADLDIFELDNLIVIGIVMGIATAKNRLDASEKLTHIKGLNNEVVSTELKAYYLVNDLSLRSDHNNRLIGEFTEFCANVLTVFAGKHDVKENKIGLVFFKYVNSLVTVGSGTNLVSLFFKRRFKKVANIAVIIDNKNFGVHFFLLILFLSPAAAVPDASGNYGGKRDCHIYIFTIILYHIILILQRVF
jgi:hypothetical protein